MVTYNNKHLELFQIIFLLESKQCFIENEEYDKFVINDLKEIIDICSDATEISDIVENYYQILNPSDISTIRYLLTFLKKYKLLDFYTYYYPGRLYSSHKDNLSKQDILDAYTNELMRLSKKEEDLRLFHIIYFLEKNNCFIENEEYNNFVINDLKGIIDKCFDAVETNDIVQKYYQVLNSSNTSTIRCLLTFLKKYKLLDFYTYYYLGRLYSSHKDNLSKQDILDAYENEIVNLQVRKKTRRK